MLFGKGAKPKPAGAVTLYPIGDLLGCEGSVRGVMFFHSRHSNSAPALLDRTHPPNRLQEIKQTLQLADFLGHNANAVHWQVWTALLAYVLLRFSAWISRWGHSFIRLFTLLRAALWLKLDLRACLESYGTAGGHLRFLGTPEQAYLPGIL